MRRLSSISFILVFSTALLHAQGSNFQEKEGFELEGQHYFEQADQFYDAKDWESATEYYAAAFEAEPGQTKALYNLAVANCKLKNYGKAEVSIKKFLELTPTDIAAYELYGQILLENSKFDQALDCFNLLVKAKPTDANYVGRAFANIQIHRNNEAMIDFDRALQLNPNNFEATLGKGAAFVELDQPKLATAWLEQALAIKPDDATALTNLAIMNFHLGEKQAAMEAFRTALRTSRNSEIYLARAQCYLLDQNYNDAIADAREAMLLDGENAAVYAFIGNVELDKGDVPGAVESFGIAIDLKPEHTDFYLRRATANITGKMYHDAVRDLYRALDLDPFNSEAKKLLQVVYSHIDASEMDQSLSGNEH